MEKLFEIKPEYHDEIPKELQHGILYISEKYHTASHLCACGCGQKTVTPLGETEWTLTKQDDKVTLRPSIGNFSHEAPNYHAHYYITLNKIEWL